MKKIAQIVKYIREEICTRSKLAWNFPNSPIAHALLTKSKNALRCNDFV